MSGINPWLGDGPATYEVSASTTGGQLVQADGSKVKPAAAGSTTVLGVALGDAEPSGTTSDPLSTVQAQPHVAVAYGVDVRVTYGAKADFGAPLVADASGKVKPYTSGTSTFDAVVGRCTEPGGVSAAGVVARARLA